MTANPVSATDTLALLDKLKTELPEIWGQAQVVGKWVWLEFNIPPAGAIRQRLKQFGFHWNGQRKCWQHPCGVPSRHSQGDQRQHYPVKAADELAMNDALPEPYAAREYTVVALRKCPLPEQLLIPIIKKLKTYFNPTGAILERSPRSLIIAFYNTSEQF